MVYDWSNKRDEIYELYVQENHSLDEVMRIMQEKYNFGPSIRAYQAQFKRWEFPHKQSTPHSDQALVKRVQELWETNVNQADMMQVLALEGFSINKRSLSRLRSKHKLYLRMPNGVRIGNQTGSGKRKFEDDEEATLSAEQQSSEVRSTAVDGVDNFSEDPAILDPQITDIQPAEENLEPQRAISPETLQRRQSRLDKLQAESDSLLLSKKRRRRTRGWSGMPADDPQPPRFPSETTLDESKAYLRLSNDLYRQVRDEFTRICHEKSIERKTTAGAEKWQAAKDALIAAVPHLHNQFHGPLDGVPRESKKLALDVICTDNTKRMRTLASRMTVNEAKTVLGLNPRDCRTVRQSFYDILRADHFHSKLESGDDHWNSLKDAWVLANPILHRETPEQNPAQSTRQSKALETLCRDVMKRLRDEQVRADPARAKTSGTGPGPGPLRPPNARAIKDLTSPPPATGAGGHIDGNIPVPSPSRPRVRPPQPHATRASSPHESSSAMQHIDPSLTSSTTPDASIAAIDQLRHYAASAESALPSTSPYYHNAPSIGSSGAATALHDSITASPQRAAPLAAVFRLQNPEEHALGPPRTWLVSLAGRTLDDVRRAATCKHPGTQARKIVGLLPAMSGREDAADEGAGAEFEVENDEEVGLFLDSVAGSKVSFAVVLAPQSS